MELIVDLHIHSSFARATSKQLTLENIYKWAKIKGINVISTADFTHPKWFSELTAKLELDENGLFQLGDKYTKPIDNLLPQSVKNNKVRFILSTEISNIYSKNGRVRRLHNLVIVPNFGIASEIISRLARIGNLNADGRPIIGMDSKELLQMTVESHPDSIFIPAHIWTPWFAMFGSNSGFDSIEEAFEELSPHIRAVETGLSSDPWMNWRLKQLDGLTIVSGSDAHSLPKLAREANVLNCDYSYKDIIDAIRTNDERFVGTLEFFPEEGMYHLDGHRKCNVKFTPTESKARNDICPVCGQKLVVGVMHRVDDLADRPEDYIPKDHKSVESIVPIVEIIAEINNVKNISSKTVASEYDRVIAALGDDFSILRHRSIDEIAKSGFTEMAVAIDKIRNKDIYIDPGYDGVYGTVKIFKPGEMKEKSGQLTLL
jgi:DNA helicase-2/ATP-dependent DNA helicase PcrA